VKIEIEFRNREECIVFFTEYAAQAVLFLIRESQYSTGCVPGILRQCRKLHGDTSLTWVIWVLRGGLIERWVVDPTRGNG